jgi:hypothetical protein
MSSPSKQQKKTPSKPSAPDSQKPIPPPQAVVLPSNSSTTSNNSPIKSKPEPSAPHPGSFVTQEPVKSSHSRRSGEEKPIQSGLTSSLKSNSRQSPESSQNLMNLSQNDKASTKDILHFRNFSSPSKPKVQKSIINENTRSIQKSPSKLENSEIIESKIKSRRRVLEMLEDQSGVNDEAFLQIQSRDLMIEELTKELIQMKTSSKSVKLENEDLIRLKTLQQRVTDLEKERLILIQEFEDLSETLKITTQNSSDDKDQLQNLVESIQEENDLLRSQLKSKDEEAQGMLEDIQKLSEIIKQFKKLNSDLNEKIEKLNTDLETLKIRSYESEVKAASLPELEGSLNEYIRAFRNAEKKEEDAKVAVKNLVIAVEDLQAFAEFVKEKSAELLNDWKKPEEIPLDGLEGVEKVELIEKEWLKTAKIREKFSELEEIVRKRKNLKFDENLDFLKKEKKNGRGKKELSDRLEKAERELRIIENQQKPLNDEIFALKELISDIHKGHQQSLENLNLSMKTLQDFNDSLRAEIQTLRLEISRKEGKITSLSSKIINSDSLLGKNEEKMRKVLEVKNLFEKENIELKGKNKTLSSQLEDKKKELSKLLSQNQNLTTNIQSLHEEFWKKDTILLKSKKNILKLEKTLNELNQNKLELPKTDEKTDKLLKELYEKDRKIEVLKEMIKSIQLKEKGKSKDSFLEASPELHPEKFEKTEKDLLNSLVAKILNKFFGICSINKTSSETPPDIPRLLKKLRQDLRIYSVFSIRDLQLSVPMLQTGLNDVKPHLNLEELMVIVSKIAYSL